MMDSMYSELILEHNKKAYNKRNLEGGNRQERGHNPNCGDDLTLVLLVEDNLIKDAVYKGSGCAISQASMSIMIDLVRGKTVDEGKVLCNRFFALLKSETLSDEELESLEDAVIFESLGKMPARIKCGTLGWHCLEVCLESEA